MDNTTLKESGLKAQKKEEGQRKMYTAVNSNYNIHLQSPFESSNTKASRNHTAVLFEYL